MKNKRVCKSVGEIYRYHKFNNSSLRSWQLLCKPICASTEVELSNWIAKRPVRKDLPKAVFASSQKYGRGQHNRNWYSPRGGVWVSAAISREGSYTNNSELHGLALALAIVERLERIGIEVKIKWPNDLLVEDKKLAGILSRLFFRGTELRLLRFGVGLNVFNNVPKDGISLKQIVGYRKMNINFWSSEVLFSIERSLDFLDNKTYLCSQVKQRLWSDKYMDKETGSQWNIKGIDSNGRLILTQEGKERLLST